MPIDALAEQLIDRLRGSDACVVAFSGGVDSAVVAAAAQRALGPHALAVTAVSPSVSADQLATARRVAGEIGIAHREVATGEMDREEYRANDGRRCFWCKQTLYEALGRFCQATGGAAIVSGTNADDLGDYRPGIDAGRRAGVRMPLAELGIGKSQVRSLARLWQLTVWDAPAAPCLSSRIAYGVPVTEARLRMIEQAEAWLRQQAGLNTLRVRLHEGDLARIEVPVEQLGRLVSPPLWKETVEQLRQIGFRFVTLDLEGFRSGNLNQLVSISPEFVAQTRTQPNSPVGAQTR